MNGTLIVGALFVPLGLLFLLLSVVVFLRARARSARCVAATGKVVELQMRPRNRGMSYHPVVEFTAPSGEVVRFTSSVGTSPPMHTVGQDIQVRYEPADPKQAYIDSRFIVLLAPCIFIFLGGVFLSVGALNLVLGLAKHR